MASKCRQVACGVRCNRDLPVQPHIERYLLGLVVPCSTSNTTQNRLLGACLWSKRNSGSRLSRGNRVPSVRDRHGSSPLPMRAPASAAAGGHDASVGHTRRPSRPGNSCRKPSVDQADRRGTARGENEGKLPSPPPCPGPSPVDPPAVVSCQHTMSVGACIRRDTFSTTRIVIPSPG